MLNTVLVFLVTLLLLLWWRSRRPHNAPPSPGLALPVIGHLYLFKGDIMEQLKTWRERLGNIFALQLGPERCVVLNGYELITEAFVKHHESFLERPDNFLHSIVDQKAGVGSIAGQKWKEQRSFLKSTLRSLGMGRNAMAERIEVERDYLLSTIESSKSEPMDISDIVMVCVTNVICGVTFGKRFNKEDEKIMYLIRIQTRLFQLIGVSAVVNYFSVLKYIPGDLFRYKELLSVVHNLRNSMLNWAEQDRRTVNVSDEAFGDVVQAFLTEMERKKVQGVTDTSFDEANLVSTAVDFFNAGTETTANTIIHAVLYLMHFPDLQAKLFQNIKDVVGMERTPDIADKNKLKFLTAFIMETQRFSHVAPLALDRLSTRDCNIGGYTIPKGTVMKINLDSMLKDKNVWGDPEVFRPERFLDSNGSLVTKKEFLPFGVGKRNCLGEGLATMELFIFISALIQKFEFHLEKEGEFPDMKPETGLTRKIKPYKVRAIPRMN